MDDPDYSVAMTTIRLIGYHANMIKRLYAHNYRCFENFELLLDGKPSSLLIGRNGSGKSTIGSVLEIFQTIGRGTNRIRDLVRVSDFAFGRSDTPMRFEIETTIAGKVYAYSLALELPDGFQELRVLDESLSVEGTIVYSRNRAEVGIVRPNHESVVTFQLDWHLIALTIIQEQSRVDPLFIFKTCIADMLILSPQPSSINGESQGDTLRPNRLVSDFGDWFSGLVAHAPASYTQIDKYLKEIMPDFRSITNPAAGTDIRRLTVHFQQALASIALPFSSLSDGEKCFVIGATVIAANQSIGPVFCYWDEPDNYLSISEVGHFVVALRRGFSNGGQLLVTSHNAEAIHRFSNENTFLIGRRNHVDPTTVRLLSDMQVHSDLITALTLDDLEPWS